MNNRTSKKLAITLCLTTLPFVVALYRVRALELEEIDIPSYTYEGDTGPAFWGQFSETCEIGESQSPINIKPPKGDDDDDDEIELEFDYESTPLVVLNNGRVVEVEYEDGSTLELDDEDDDETFELEQFHFHTRSEHRIAGEQFDAEAHLVHLNEAGEVAVVGIFIEAGEESEILGSILANVPPEGFKVEVPGSEVDANDLLPENRDIYTYSGSFTTPPCTEGVTWLVFASPIEASEEQIEQLTNVFTFSNFRPIQPLNDRDIQLIEADDDDDD